MSKKTILANPRINPARWGIKRIVRELKDYPTLVFLLNGKTVKGDLDLRGTKITSLPEGLKVGGNLYLENTPITSLPEGLKVGRHLDLEGTPITSLPEGLKVGRDIFR